MIELAWVISLIGAFLLGYQYQKLNTLVKELKQSLAEIPRKKKIEPPKSTFFDADDVVANTKREQAERLRSLNDDM